MKQITKEMLKLSYEDFEEAFDYDETMIEQGRERFAEVYDILVGLTEGENQRAMSANGRNKHGFALAIFEYMLGESDENPLIDYFDLVGLD